jgi:hypothetical protein
MAKTGFQLDIAGFEKQIEQLKKKIEQGVQDGFNDGKDYLEGIMKFYVDQEVYNVYEPVEYVRTNDLFYSIQAKVVGNAIYVYSNPNMLQGNWSMTVDGKMYDHNGLPYVYRVLGGDDKYSYEFHNGGAYEEPRNFVEATKEEFVQHMNQSKQFMKIVINAIQRRI